ncbi:hypothetical protein AGABI1DRAFT_117552 [Agaricus bisporus var. burnettii JB137-S8]|uniref:Vta1/callose synthase N-terminal domain-containing protein n=1 Tax=Agaricus bisporus var. burnettii (strain JB137-S8 / ATCC MYA-4627 / FGSC 10392) TaxID=597362 RepID=K5XKQ6_AGABU|nr:uncharacterized protein AGABI1DRAFT_117552 [Agaricus bisporus var. burnettii JB137-S8]EKM84108.1 hypothetical protein AGABI1DRAFT_117552 [Agaricus bisporus var. burnettii JB137-S8]
MSSQQLLGLPPISPDLRPIVPYLQRADELKVHEPIIAYWCAYYAAQLGLGLKARDNASRDVLFKLLGVLEHMKQEIGSVDAIEVEAASAAFVENFALKVFQSADNEDRRGAVTRTTAKKFLAASNFLEVLKIFPKVEVSESNEEKIRYAKWKAADISKALREGRKPLPGPADQELDDVAQDGLPATERGATSPPSDHSIKDSNRVASPSGSTHVRSSPKYAKVHSRDESGSSTRSKPESLRGPRTVTVSELDDESKGSSSPTHSNALKSQSREGSPESQKQTRFSPTARVIRRSPPPPEAASPSEAYQGPPSIYAPQERNSPSPIHSINSASEHMALPSPPRAPVSSYIYAAPSQPTSIYTSSPPRSYPPPMPPTHPPPVDVSNVELTPSMISKVQRHCKFAISSLDYEDAEQAKKELRMALSLLGGL